MEEDKGLASDLEDQRFVRPGYKSYLASHVSTLLILGGNLLSYKLCASYLDEAAFSEYAVTKRTLAYAGPVIASGIGIAVSHFVAKCRSQEKHLDGAYFQAASLLLGAYLLPLFVVALLWPEASAFLFFGESGHEAIILPMLLMTCGVGLVNLCQCFCEGKMEVVVSSAIGGLASGLLPILAILATRAGADKIFLFQGSGLLVIGLVSWLFFVRRKTLSNEVGPSQRRAHVGRLLKYGLPRIPGAFAVSALLALPITLSAHSSDSLILAGVLSVGAALMTAAAAAVNPLATILLPQSSRLLEAGMKGELKRQVLKIAALIAAIAIPALLLTALWIKPILTLYLSEELAEHSDLVLWILPAALPFAYYRCFRSVVDGAYQKAYNTINSLLALLAFAIWYGIAHQAGWPQPELQAHLLGVSLLGVLTIYRVFRVFDGDGLATKIG